MLGRPPATSRRWIMCLNCGCGEPETRHKESDITLDDVREAATGSSLEETLRNMRTSIDKLDRAGSQMGGSQARA